LVLDALRDAIPDRVLEPVAHLIELLLALSPLVAAGFAAPGLHGAHGGLNRVLQSLAFIRLWHHLMISIFSELLASSTLRSSKAWTAQVAHAGRDRVHDIGAGAHPCLIIAVR